MRAKSTTLALTVLKLGSKGASGQRFVLASCQPDGSCARSYSTSWTEKKFRRLPAWLGQRPQVARTTEELDELLRAASRALRHGNATPSGRANARSAGALGAGRWPGRLNKRELLGEPGCVVGRQVVAKEDCAAILEACKVGFNAAALDQRGKGIAKRAVTRLAGRKVHADLDSRGRATLRSLTRAELPDADAAWSSAVRSVSVFAGHDPAASSDEAATVCASGMPQQKWHQDSAAALAYVVALSDGVEGTQFVQMDGAWRDLMALKPAAREAFMRSAWAAAAAEQPRVASGGTLSAGDVLFFYTKRIHRAPPPPAARSPRYTLFGAFCKQGKTDGPPVVQGPR